jgi:TPR repeat protein
MPTFLISCVSLPPATILSVPVHDFAIANEDLADEDSEVYYPCCGKSICKGCVYSFCKSGNAKCPFCNSDRGGKTDGELVEIMKRVEANDAASIYFLANSYNNGLNGFQQDEQSAIELYSRAVDLGCNKAYYSLGLHYKKLGDMKKTKFHWEAAAMEGNHEARFNLGVIENNSRNLEQAIKHWTIGASAGHFGAMNALRKNFEVGAVTRESIESILTEYNNSCAEMRSEARDAYIRFMDKNRGT